MPFPESPRVVYRNNPLVEVICQLRFPAILEISAEPPAAFQRMVRGSYPDYEKTSGVELPNGLPAELGQLAGPLLGGSATHRFVSADGRRAITLNERFVALSESEYRNWEGVRSQISLARTSLEGVYAPSYYSRIGLRYLNFVDREGLGLASQPWANLLNRALVGPMENPEIATSIQDIQSNFVVRIDDVPGGRARVRHGLGNRGLDDRAGYIIDIDLSTEEVRNGADVDTTLDQFNRIIGNFFRWAISPQLAEALGSMDAPSD